MPREKNSLVGGLMKVTAGSLSAGAALVSILNYTHRAELAAGTEPPATRAHRLAVTPTADTARSLADSIQLAALVTDHRGAALLGVAPAWISTDPAVAQVDQAGTVVARGAGTTAILVRVGSLEGRARIVVAPRPASLHLADSVVGVPEGEQIRVTAEARDARGNPLPGAAVRWQSAAPAVAAVDTLGEVRGVSPGRATLTASLGELRAELAADVFPVPASITVLAGEDQRAAAGRPLPAPVSAQIVSRTGRPIPGVVAAFLLRESGGLAVPALDTSDARGVVQTVWTLDPTPGRQQLAITVDGVAVSPVLTAEADPVAANARVSLAGEIVPGVAGDSLREPLAVRVTDSTGAPLADLPVAWSTSDGGALTPLGARTDSAGEARAMLRLGSRAGRQRLKVQVGNPRTMPAFTMTVAVLPGEAESLSVQSGDGQRGTAGKPLARPLVLRVHDRHGNGVPGAAVSAAPSAGRLADSVVRTDSSGRARLQWTLGREAGPQTLAVRLAGTGRKVEVSARAAPGPAARLELLYEARSIVVEVSDAFGNPLAGRRVALSATGGSVSPARVETDRSGRAKVRWTPGRKSAKASVSGTVEGTKVAGRLTLPRAP